ncbi:MULTISPECIES: type II toxin-antitoxin system HicB family antitoxin [Rodentibacter]|nr:MULTISPECIES: type II toxin-antitoxin system HicB family antitoxin [Rodentibacter]
MMLFYPAIFEPDEKSGYVAHFPQFGGFTQGETIEETKEMCEDLLISYLEDYFDMDKEIPMPDKVQKGQYAIALPTLMVAKVLLHNELVKRNINKASLARLLDASPAEVQRIMNLRHNTKINTIDRAFEALGKQLKLSLA